MNLHKYILVTKWKKVKVYLYMHHMYNYHTCNLASEKTRQVNMIRLCIEQIKLIYIAQLQAGKYYPIYWF